MESWSPFKRALKEGLTEGAKGAVGALRSKGAPSLMSPLSQYALTNSERKPQRNLNNAFRKEAGQTLNTVKRKLFNTPSPQDSGGFQPTTSNITPKRPIPTPMRKTPLSYSSLLTPQATPAPIRINRSFVAPKILTTVGQTPEHQQMRGGTRKRKSKSKTKRSTTLKRRRLQ
jgi:hypothetical protein